MTETRLLEIRSQKTRLVETRLVKTRLVKVVVGRGGGAMVVVLGIVKGAVVGAAVRGEVGPLAAVKGGEVVVKAVVVVVVGQVVVGQVALLDDDRTFGLKKNGLWGHPQRMF
jgi:hypothetical protein